MTNNLSFKEKWYFIKQDIITYLISTIIYLFLCLIINFTFQSFIYALFECMLFYVSFWFIRVNFENTFHSDEWSKCKKYTRIMLILGIFILWILPIKYSLFNSIAVAFTCSFVLYLIANETDEKKKYKHKNKVCKQKIKKLNSQVQYLLSKLNHKDIYSMNEQELYDHCRKCGLSDVECKIAYYVVIERLKGKDLYEAIGYSSAQSKRKRKAILDKINN